MEKEQQKIYCSLDIETSGFDPLTNEILEVGFAFFTLGKSGAKITEEWTQVFKPSKPVPPQIFGLTGISQAELDGAPQFSEFHSFLQEKLGNAIIVGHNITFDTKFLESFGIKFSGQTIDTLDLVQFILPTHHSYNLENLMHTFGISHKEAHRALADSKATLRLLEKLLSVYSGFPQELKTKITEIIKPHGFLWASLLETGLAPLIFSEVLQGKKTKKQKKSLTTSLKWEPNVVYNFGMDESFLEILASIKSEEKFLLVTPRAQTSLDLFKQGLVETAVFMPEMQFDEKKFAAALKLKSLSPDEVKFLLKILVWKFTNWQNSILLDLNLSFFGGQFKNMVSGLEIKENKQAKVISCDMATFLYLSENKLYKNRRVIICGLNELESSITANIGTKTSWGYVNYLLRSFYNPELSAGQEKYKEAVESGLLAGDLFFGLVNALLQTDPPGFQYFKISPQIEQDERYMKIKNASVSFLEKLRVTNKVLSSKEIEKFAGNLESFFQTEDNKVKWIELSERSCGFLSMPLDITGLVKNILNSFAEVSFADVLDEKIMPAFFLNRLGLQNFKQLEAKNLSSASNTDKQGDLFSGIKKALGVKAEKINYHAWDTTAAAKDIMEILKGNKSWPAAVLLAGPTQVKAFYDENYQELKSRVSLLAQTSSGGSNKIFRNFSINSNSLLLATDKFILKSLNNQSAIEPVKKLAVKTLILCHLPFEQFTHPYQEALSKALPNAFEDYSLPRALYNFHSIIKFFYTPELEDIYIIEPKLAKPYAKVFKDYWKNIPRAEFKQ